MRILISTVLLLLITSVGFAQEHRRQARLSAVIRPL
jgi:hypothetical protein